MATSSVSINVESCVHALKFFDREAGEEVCGNCGIVLNQNMEVMQVEELLKHSHNTLRLYDSGLFTNTGNSDMDYNGGPINAFTGVMNTLNRWSMVHDTKMKNLNKAMKTLESVSVPLQLTVQIKDRAAYLYRKALKAGLVRGRSINGIMGACIYIACREMNRPITPLVIQELIKDERALIAEFYRLLSRRLDISLPIQEGNIYLNKFAQRCNLSEKSVRLAAEILDKVKMDEGFQGKSGRTLAAAALFLAAIENGERMTQDMMSEASGVTTVTIRLRCRELSPIAGIEIMNLKQRSAELRHQRSLGELIEQKVQE